MTEMVPVEDFELSEITQQPTTKAIQRLEMEARAMKTAFQLATSLSKTTMVPECYQQSYTGTYQKPHPPLGEVAAHNLTAAILYGAEIGLSAVQSAQNVFVVKGKPAVYARTMAAQVRAAGYQLEEVSAETKAVVWKALRDGEWAYSEWSIGRAEMANYTTNKLYQTNPIEMLRAKCIAELCRMKFQDILLGMNYSVEELQLMDNVVITRPVKKQGAKGVASLRELANVSAQPEKSVPEQPTEEPAEPPLERKDQPKPEQPPAKKETPAEKRARAQEIIDTVEAKAPGPDPQTAVPQAATTPQLAKIRALYKSQGITGKDVLVDAALLLGKPVEDLADISQEDASFIANAIQGPVEE